MRRTLDRRDLADLLVFQAVADAGSFSRAAASLGRAQSGISQAISDLEGRLGVPLLARSTRSLRLTEAGQRLLERVAPALRQVAEGLDQASQGHDQPSGLLRITAMEHPARTVLIPALPSFLEKFPAVTVDVDVSDRFVDIVERGFDAGIRFGSHLQKDMVALPIGPDIRAVIVGSPAYFANHGKPQRLEDLAAHDCINYRTASHGDVFRWQFRQGKRTTELTVGGRMLVNHGPALVAATLAGLGLAYSFEPQVEEHLASGALETCLEAFCPTWSGYHLYYPGRLQKSAALAALVDHLRQWRRGR